MNIKHLSQRLKGIAGNTAPGASNDKPPRSKLLWAGLVAIIVILLIGWLAGRKDDSPKQPVATGKAVVQITAGGFVPATLKVPYGTEVEWINADSEPRRVASNPHPDHSDVPGLNSKDSIQPGGSYKFIVTQPGTVGYHDHTRPTVNGTLQVEEK